MIAAPASRLHTVTLGLNACGLVVINAPWTLAQEWREARDAAQDMLDERKAEPVRSSLSVTSLFAWTYGRSEIGT
jgi:23S rRNA A2030 N6-methylase RlmJ